jgi:hypothetical protein
MGVLLEAERLWLGRFEARPQMDFVMSSAALGLTFNDWSSQAAMSFWAARSHPLPAALLQRHGL